MKTDKSAIADLSFIKILLYLVARDRIRLPTYSGSTLRGALGYALRKVCCIMPDRDCNDCLVKASCVYAYTFETPFHEGFKEISGTYKLSNYPHPLIIEPPFSENNEFQPGDSFSCNLILIGRAVRILPYFIYAFTEMGRRGIGSGRGKFHVKMASKASRETEFAVYDGASEKMLGSIKAQCIKDCVSIVNGNCKLKLTFKTPTRIKSQNDLTARLDFQLLMKNLLRRLSILARVHEEKNWELDYKYLLDKAAREVICTDSKLYWYDWERYSNRQKSRMKLGGFIGDIVFSGDLSEFLPYIKMGEYLHVGKQTSFGLGKYEMHIFD